ncbi:ABC transporter type 1, transmembrane domain-containing protein [Diplogelasinospora grovesii]|uniref:ABC transporter type 1, transmembrane domain-containing protein n=1 Tax=Diplogelasinospora grovesii TaxID=303347 RepID=A0AAN6N976_9PEZI|nr:ABC transporter type 1, transmembrane domain-containing protein [Diplogelasinospora grovesii]
MTYELCRSNFIKLSPKVGEVLYYNLLKTVISFSQDISYLDDSLPFALFIVVTQIFRLISQMFLLFITQASLVICGPPLFIVLYFLQKFYLHESRQIRFLDLESRAAVYTSFLETLEGISAIRALGWQSHSVDQNIAHLDVSQTPHYMMKVIQLWLTLVLDLLVTGLAVMVISLAVALRSSTTGGQIGLALSVVMVIAQLLSLETSLGAVARIKTLEATLQPEDKENEDFEPSEEWPKQGSIEFRDVTASYNITHRLDTIQDTDLIIVLDKGTLVEAGAPEDLLTKRTDVLKGEKAWFREL